MLMSEERTMSEYTWISAAKYIQWLEFKCSLKDVNVTDIWSMRMAGKTGWNGLLSRKIKLECTIRENKRSIEELVESDHVFADEEKNIITCFLGNLDRALEILDGQVKTVSKMVEFEQTVLDLEYEDIDPNDYPF